MHHVQTWQETRLDLFSSLARCRLPRAFLAEVLTTITPMGPATIGELLADVDPLRRQFRGRGRIGIATRNYIAVAQSTDFLSFELSMDDCSRNMCGRPVVPFASSP